MRYRGLFMFGAVALAAVGASRAEAQAYRAAYFLPPITQPLNPGQSFDVTVGVQNIGGLVWARSGSTPVRLGHVWVLASDSSVTFFSAPTDLPRDLRPGDRVPLTVRLSAPPRSGIYTLQWYMFQEGVPASFADVPIGTQSVAVGPIPRVTQAVERLCVEVACAGVNPATATPVTRISRVMGVVTPGGRIAIEGIGFGTGTGQVQLSFGGPLPGWSFGASTWQPNLVVATIPTDITGVPDQPAALLTVRGVDVAVPFVAARDVQVVPGSYAGVRNVRCDVAGGSDTSCSWHGGTIHATHVTDLAARATGTDLYRIDLPTGWRLVNVAVAGGSTGVGNVSQDGAGQIRVDWTIGCCIAEVASYAGRLLVSGPRGVPLR